MTKAKGRGEPAGAGDSGKGAPAPKKKAGRPVSFTAEMKAVALRAVKAGLSYETAAHCAGVHYETLRRHLREDEAFCVGLEKAAATGKLGMVDRLVAAADAGNVVAMIFWLKTRTTEFREVREVELRGADETADQIRRALDLARSTVPRGPRGEKGRAA